MSRSSICSLPAFLALAAAACSSHAPSLSDQDSEEVETVSTQLRGGSTTLQAGVVAYQITNANGYCTGSMIAPNVVLTAAHCLDSVGAATNTSGLATVDYVDYYDPDAGRREVFSGVLNWTVASSWPGIANMPPAPNGSNNDIAILKIDRTFEATDYHDYIRIFSGVDSDLAGMSLVAFGAGFYTYGSHYDGQLRSAAFPVVELSDFHLTVETRQYDGVCHGDSGGPLVKYSYQNGTPVPVVAGVLSDMETADTEGEGCGENDAPDNLAYYSRTTVKLPWLENVAGIQCTSAGAVATTAYARCFALPFVEDLPGEGVYERDVAAAIVTTLL